MKRHNNVTVYKYRAEKRDSKNKKIVHYLLYKDEALITKTGKELKEEIATNKTVVLGLKLTRDNRLIRTSVENSVKAYLHNTSVDKGDNRYGLGLEIDGLLYTEVKEEIVCSCVDKSLKKVNILDCTTAINHNGFENSSVETVDLPEGLKYISFEAFKNCKNLIHINVPKNVLLIDNFAFEGCTKMVSTRVYGRTRLGNSLYAGCTNLKSALLDNFIGELGINTFKGCENLEVVRLSENVSYINDGAFSYCNKLQTIILPKLTETSPRAFIGTPAKFKIVKQV